MSEVLSMTLQICTNVDITIPLAFDLVAQQVDDVSVAARRGIRDRMKDGKVYATLCEGYTFVVIDSR